MERVKVPFGGLTADQLVGLALASFAVAFFAVISQPARLDI